MTSREFWGKNESVNCIARKQKKMQETVFHDILFCVSSGDLKTTHWATRSKGSTYQQYLQSKVFILEHLGICNIQARAMSFQERKNKEVIKAVTDS